MKAYLRLAGCILLAMLCIQLNAQLTNKLKAVRLGSAGQSPYNTQGVQVQLVTNNELNTVLFIRLNDPFATGTNVSRIRYDISKNRGTTWQYNKGNVNNAPAIDNSTMKVRYPQAAIYNPAGNTIADSAYLIYSSSWHELNQWKGSVRGRGKLSGDTSTYNVDIATLNGGNGSSIGLSMCQSTPGTFWSINPKDAATFSAGGNNVTGLIISKGVWNTGTKNVDWTETLLPQTFTIDDRNGVSVSVFTSWNIAFDPSGQYGWISALGDITDDNIKTYSPIFWRTTNGGQTWSSAMQIDLNEVPGVKQKLKTILYDGQTPATRIPTTTFESALSVDVNGNPHLLTTVGNSDEYSVQLAGYDLWDFTYDATGGTGCQWVANYIAHVKALRGTMTADNPAYTQDNKPLISRTPDGTKLFLFWTDTDIDAIGTPDNDHPNLFGRSIDVQTAMATPIYNFSEGDSIFGARTNNFIDGAIYGGVRFPSIAPIAFDNGSSYNVPLVLTQVDYFNNEPEVTLGSGAEPAAFWYSNRINFAASAYTENADAVAPVITLNGNDTVLIVTGGTYTEQGAVASDCNGSITPVLFGQVNVNTPGVYPITYVATDFIGNSDTVVRVVIVGNIPTADFTWSFPQLPNKAQFFGSGTNIPTSWLWNFGDGGGSTLQNPVRQYFANGVYSVCLTATNSFGSSAPTCHNVTITGGFYPFTVSLGNGPVQVCNGSILAPLPNMQHGVPPYTYQWSSNGSPLDCNTCARPTSLITQSTTYTLTVTDAANATATASITYNVSSVQNNISAVVTNTHISCDNPVDTATIVLTGGLEQYTIAWGNGMTMGGDTQQNTYTQPGIYMLVIADANPCFTVLYDTVLNNGIEIVANEVVMPACIGSFTGKIVLDVSGGTAPYIYTWSNGSNNDSLVNMPPGTYNLTVTDVNGCSASSSYILTPLSTWGFFPSFSITQSNCNSNGAILTNVNGGALPLTYNWNNSSTAANLTNISGGNYSVTITDAVGCRTTGSAQVNTDCSNIISGTVFVDANSNCVQNNGEQGRQAAIIEARNNNGTAVYYATTDENGFYELRVNQTGTYDLTLSANNLGCVTTTFCGSTTVNIPVINGDTLSNRNIAQSLEPGIDLTTYNTWTNANPGFNATYTIYPYNQSPNTYNGTATVSFTHDSAVAYLGSTGAGAYNAATRTVTWQINTVTNDIENTTSIVSVNLYIPLTVLVSQTLSHTVHISSPALDCDTFNNTIQILAPVTGSYDPNEKQVIPAGDILEEDSILTYTIHFQNTGNDSTHFVILKDQLASYVDAGTARTIASSHPYSNFSVSGTGLLTWVFDPLKLVDSATNEEGSKGFVVFRVKKKPGLPIGTNIANYASIYFDYNAPIVTNTVTSKLTIPNSIGKVNSADISVSASPNPFNAYTDIAVEGIQGNFDFNMYDMTGRIVHAIPAVGNKQFRIYGSSLAEGVYLYRVVTSDGKTGHGKVVMQR